MDKIKNSARLMTFVGFAAKTRQLVSGAQGCEGAIKSKEALVVLLSAEVSQNTLKHYAELALFRGVPLYQLDDDRLGSAIGKPERKAVCITGKQFADAIINEINLNLGVKE